MARWKLRALFYYMLVAVATVTAYVVVLNAQSDGTATGAFNVLWNTTWLVMILFAAAYLSTKKAHQTLKTETINRVSDYASNTFMSPLGQVMFFLDDAKDATTTEDKQACLEYFCEYLGSVNTEPIRTLQEHRTDLITTGADGDGISYLVCVLVHPRLVYYVEWVYQCIAAQSRDLAFLMASMSEQNNMPLDDKVQLLIPPSDVLCTFIQRRYDHLKEVYTNGGDTSVDEAYSATYK